MNMYKQMKEKHTQEVNAFPMMFAFSNEQFIKVMDVLGVTDKSDLLSIGCGGFIRKSDKNALDNLLEKHDREFKEAIVNDPTGDGFIYDMFNYELANHEYCYTYDVSDTLDALGFTMDYVNSNKNVLNGLIKAVEYQKSQDEY